MFRAVPARFFDVIRMPVSTSPAPVQPVPAPDTRFRNAIEQELLSVTGGRETLLAPGTKRPVEILILLGCILVNAIYLLYRRDYVNLFVAASFYLNMGYFITLLVPTSPGGAQFSFPEITRFQSWLKENGIKTGTTRFTRVFINAFFMNSRALSLGIGLLFSFDILLVLTAFLEGLPLHITVIMIIQCSLIILFYYLVWRTEPFTSTFEQNLDNVKSRLARDLPPWLISFLFLTGFLLVGLVFLTTIILLPGMTLDAFLTQSGLTELAHLFGLVAILVISQYFIIRYIHGITSRVMAKRLLHHRVHALEDLLAATRTDCDAGQASGEGGARFEHTSALVESRIYAIKRNTLLETFPVFVVDLDFSVLLDSTTQMAIKGYIRKD